MRNLVRALAVTVILPLAVTATGTSGQAAESPLVTGGTHLTVDASVFDPTASGPIEMKDLSYNARGRAPGSASGWWNYQETEPGASLHASGDVTCLVVRGNHAWIGGVVVRADDPSYVGSDAWWQVQDNGAGADHPADMTTFVGFGEAGRAQDYCNRAPTSRFPFDVQSGQVTVH
ncbi:MAG: hypothetical protein QOI82_2946 [Actinomycetota bacterium]|jgi:hypothetical protein|nr:hypothetical protein [Actinomycetota bacterium]